MKEEGRMSNPIFSSVYYVTGGSEEGSLRQVRRRWCRFELCSKPGLLQRQFLTGGQVARWMRLTAAPQCCCADCLSIHMHAPPLPAHAPTCRPAGPNRAVRPVVQPRRAVQRA